MADLKYTPLDEIEKVSTVISFSQPKVTGYWQYHADLRAGFKTGKLRSIEYRKYQLLQLAYMLKDNVKRFEDALKSDLGRPALEGHFLEINTSTSDVLNAYNNLEKWAKPEKPGFHINFTVMRPVIYKEAKGVVLIISPFNYPLWLTVPIVASALAAGNAVLLKPSEATPAMSGLLAELLPKYVDIDLVRVVNGSVAEASKVSLIAYQHKSFYPEWALPSGSETFTRIVTPQAWKRLKGLLDNTKGTVVIGGESDEATKFIAPTVVTDVKTDDSLMSEEIFGPLLPIMAVEDVDEAIAYVNAHDHPLALYVFSPNAEFKEKGMRSFMTSISRASELSIIVFNNTTSGAAWKAYLSVVLDLADVILSALQNYTLFNEFLDGAHTGKYGFDAFTHLRASLDSPSWVDMIIGFRFPPYNDSKLKKTLKMFPRLPARPTGPPSGALRSKRWGKWFLLAFAMALIGGLTQRLKALRGSS
ncbi:hypothetical protein H0H93_001417 [Arthromyces matolae]|nr:hypothetical protein H0H93_001417 [Arthromyces matolae]